MGGQQRQGARAATTAARAAAGALREAHAASPAARRARPQVLAIMQNSDYYVPPTQCNAAGVPQGGYLDMASFITDQGFKTGKGGYQKDYPPLYVVRPDGSTLYTYRDIVYSFRKARERTPLLTPSPSPGRCSCCC